MNDQLNDLLMRRLNEAGVLPGSSAHQLCRAIVELIETDRNVVDAETVFNAFADRLIEKQPPRTTALHLLHFISENIDICPIGK